MSEKRFGIIKNGNCVVCGKKLTNTNLFLCDKCKKAKGEKMFDKNEFIIATEIELEKIDQLAKKGIWVSNGKQIKIKDMTTEHIKNCIKYINKNKITLDSYIGVFEEELKKRESDKQ